MNSRPTTPKLLLETETSPGPRSAPSEHGGVEAGDALTGVPETTVDVWTWDLQQGRPLCDSLHGLLDADERRRAAAFLRDELSQRFVLSHGVLRLVLSRYVGSPAENLQFEQGAYGKPDLVGEFASVHFNLSHSNELCVIAVSREAAVGVDVEFIREIGSLEPLTARIASVEERGVFDRLPASERQHWFLRTWTRKEAIAKAVGMGLQLPFTQFTVRASESSPSCAVSLPAIDQRRPAAANATPAPETMRNWTVQDIRLGADYVGAVALPTRVAVGRRQWTLAATPQGDLRAQLDAPT